VRVVCHVFLGVLYLQLSCNSRNKRVSKLYFSRTFPIKTSTGSFARWYPRGDNSSCPSNAPT
jgi:hypothetical protein